MSKLDKGASEPKPKKVKKVKEPKVEVKAPTVTYSSLTIMDNPKVATHTMTGTINDSTHKEFREFLNKVFEHNRKIDDDARENAEKVAFNKIHDPEAKSTFVFKKDKIERINLIIDSYGGACRSMMNITALMEASPIPIDTYCFGVAMSAGFMIFVHGKRRYLGTASDLMTHSLSTMVWDNAPNILTQAEQINKLNQIFQKIISSKTGLTMDWMKENEKIDVHFFADEAVKLKIADVIVEY